ncbi:MAG: S9 family peptidase [Christensenellales bacterium]|jgi:dipeptidyl aminopeptidase/acylaminoacyl peptidase
MSGLKLADFCQYEFLSRLSFSPGAKRSALVAAKANDSNGYSKVLWVNDSARGMFRLARIGADGLYLWQDDDTIIFCDERNERNERNDENKEAPSGAISNFYLISLNGGEAVPAFSIPLKVKDIGFLGDGLFIVLCIHDENNFDSEKNGHMIIDELPFWSNGQGFINGVRSRLYLYDAKTDALTPITGPDDDVTGFCCCQRGGYAAYTIKQVDIGHVDKDSLFIYDPALGASQKLMDGKLNISALACREDLIVFAATDAKTFGVAQNPAFYKASREGGPPSLLLKSDYTVGRPVGGDCRLGSGRTFALHEKSIYFTSTRGFACDLYRFDIDGLELSKLTDGRGSVDFFDISPGGEIEFVAFFGQELQELYRIDENGGTCLSSFNSGFIKEHPPVAPRHHVFTDADGFEIDGWAMLPPGFDPDKKYPAILNIHGGPKSLFGEIYFHEMQWLCGLGYVIMYCNPRGSDGKGSSFSAVRGSYGTFDYDNIIQFTDEMLKAYPAIDPLRIGVMGGSYGGFMVNWIITHTDRFAAAVSQRSISNWITFCLTSDIGHYFGPDQMQASVWGDAEKLWAASPVKYADNAKTPTLFLHSDQDYRCWLADAFQMYSALKINGTPTRLCLFKGENHELSRSGRPEARKVRLQETADWMERYLK